MNDVRLSGLAASAEADALARLLDAGYLELRSGPPPSSPDEPASGALLATLRFDAPSAGPARDGIVIFGPLVSDRDAVGGDDAGHFRAYTLARKAVWDGTVGVTGTTLILNSTYIRPHSRVVIGTGALAIERGVPGASA